MSIVRNAVKGNAVTTRALFFTLKTNNNMNIERFINQTLTTGHSSHSMTLGMTIQELIGDPIAVVRGYNMHVEYHLIPADYYTLHDIVSTYIKGKSDMLCDDDTFITSEISRGLLKISTYKLINDEKTI